VNNIELVNYLVERAVRDNVNDFDALHRSIEEALKDRLNEAVKLVQDFDVNKPFSDLLTTFVYVQHQSKTKPKIDLDLS